MADTVHASGYAATLAETRQFETLRGARRASAWAIRPIGAANALRVPWYRFGI